MVKARSLKTDKLYAYRYNNGYGMLQRECDLPRVDQSAYRKVASIKYAPTTKTLKGKVAVLDANDHIVFEAEDGETIDNKGIIERVTKDMTYFKTSSGGTIKVHHTSIATDRLSSGDHLPAVEEAPPSQAPAEALASTQIKVPLEMTAALDRFVADGIDFKLSYIVHGKKYHTVESMDLLNRDGRGPLRERCILLLARRDEIVFWDNDDYSDYDYSDYLKHKKSVVTLKPGDRVPISHFSFGQGVIIKEGCVVSIGTSTFRVEYVNPSDALELCKRRDMPTDLVAAVATTVDYMRDEAKMRRLKTMKARRHWRLVRNHVIQRRVFFYWMELPARGSKQGLDTQHAIAEHESMIAETVQMSD